MIYFTLPNFYENLEANIFIHDLCKMHSEYFKEKVSFYSLTGAFPFSSWNGGINCNVGHGAFYGHFVDMQNNAPLVLPARLNMANVLLEPEDYYDHMNNAILKIYNDGSTVLEVSSIPLMEHIQEKYPEYRFMLSSQADLITPFTPEVLNSLFETEKFTLVGLPIYLNHDFDFLKQLKHKTKVEITVNPICPDSCEGYRNCWLAEHQNQIEYSGAQNILNCANISKFLNVNNIISLEEIKNTYIPLGFNHFTFSTQYLLNQNEMVDFYIQYFIKDEYKRNAFEEWAQHHPQR
jgi:hypothetical protein